MLDPSLLRPWSLRRLACTAPAEPRSRAAQDRWWRAAETNVPCVARTPRGERYSRGFDLGACRSDGGMRNGYETGGHDTDASEPLPTRPRRRAAETQATPDVHPRATGNVDGGAWATEPTISTRPPPPAQDGGSAVRSETTTDEDIYWMPRTGESFDVTLTTQATPHRHVEDTETGRRGHVRPTRSPDGTASKYYMGQCLGDAQPELHTEARSADSSVGRGGVPRSFASAWRWWPEPRLVEAAPSSGRGHALLARRCFCLSHGGSPASGEDGEMIDASSHADRLGLRRRQHCRRMGSGS